MWCVFIQKKGGGGVLIFIIQKIFHRDTLSVLCLKILSGTFSEHGRTKQKTAIKYSISGREKMKSEFVHAAKSQDSEFVFVLIFFSPRMLAEALFKIVLWLALVLLKLRGRGSGGGMGEGLRYHGSRSPSSVWQQLCVCRVCLMVVEHDVSSVYVHHLLLHFIGFSSLDFSITILPLISAVSFSVSVAFVSWLSRSFLVQLFFFFFFFFFFGFGYFYLDLCTFSIHLKKNDPHHLQYFFFFFFKSSHRKKKRRCKYLELVRDTERGMFLNVMPLPQSMDFPPPPPPPPPPC